MRTITRRALLTVIAGVGGLGALLAAFGCSLGDAVQGAGGAAPPAGTAVPPAGTAAPLAGGGMMGSATTEDMSGYMDLFSLHQQIRRTVHEIPGGVRTTTESDNPEIAARLQEHVASMYQHLDQGQQVQCMSDSLATMFADPSGYRRQLTVTAKGVTVTETSDVSSLTQAIRAHAAEVTGFVDEGMSAMMGGMMGG